jgi:hypothetical protein
MKMCVRKNVKHQKRNVLYNTGRVKRQYKTKKAAGRIENQVNEVLFSWLLPLCRKLTY